MRLVLRRLAALTVGTALLLPLAACSKDKESEQATASQTSSDYASDPVPQGATSDKASKHLQNAYKKILTNPDKHLPKQLTKPNAKKAKYIYSLARMSKNSVPQLLVTRADLQGSYPLAVFSFNGNATPKLQEPLVTIGKDKDTTYTVKQSPKKPGIVVTARNDKQKTTEKTLYVVQDAKLEKSETVTGTSSDAKVTNFEKDAKELRFTPSTDTKRIDAIKVPEAAAEAVLGQDHSLTKSNKKPKSLTKGGTNGSGNNSLTAGSDANISQEVAKARAAGKDVFSGTIRIYTTPELLRAQKTSNPNPDSPDCDFAVLVFDHPISILATNGDGQGRSVREAKMLLLGYKYASKSSYRYDTREQLASWSVYRNKHLMISVDNDQVIWPSDTRLPLGQPGVGDATVTIIPGSVR